MPTPANDTSNTAARVKKLMVEHLGVAPEKVTDTALIQDDLGADSLDAVELMMACEGEFGIEIADEEFEKVRTVADAVGLVERKVGERKHGAR